MYIASDYGTLVKNYPSGPVSFVASNIGKNHLTDGPIVQIFGHTTIALTPGFPQMLMNSYSVTSGKYGTFIVSLAMPELGKEKSKKHYEITMQIHQLVKERGADVSVEDIVKMYQEGFSGL